MIIMNYQKKLNNILHKYMYEICYIMFFSFNTTNKLYLLTDIKILYV